MSKADKFAGTALKTLKSRGKPDEHPLRESDFSARIYISEIPIERIEPDPDQPRTVFDETSLNELAASIREKGVIKPLIVQEIVPNERYRIIAGERRWRASQLAGKGRVPCIVKHAGDDAFILSLIENVQRENLTLRDESRAYAKLAAQGMTQQEIKKVTGKSQPHISTLVKIWSFLSAYHDKHGTYPVSGDGSDMSQEALYQAAGMPYSDGEAFVHAVAHGKLKRDQVRQQAARKSSPQPRTVTKRLATQWCRRVRSTIGDGTVLSDLTQAGITAEELDETIRVVSGCLERLQAARSALPKE